MCLHADGTFTMWQFQINGESNIEKPRPVQTVKGKAPAEACPIDPAASQPLGSSYLHTAVLWPKINHVNTQNSLALLLGSLFPAVVWRRIALGHYHHAASRRIFSLFSILNRSLEGNYMLTEPHFHFPVWESPIHHIRNFSLTRF